jgi:Fe-S-cluster containining protein
MTTTPANGGATLTADVQLSVGDWQFAGKMTVPSGRTPLRVLLPVVQSLADGLVEMAVRTVEGRGEAVSCKKGCGACCRQLVPISEVEARQIGALVEAMPEPRRSEIRTRFAEARRRLQESGMLDKLQQRGAWADEAVQQIGLDYFHLGIPCPFLEEESCSIHPDRPITCREYLVTSPAENCARPTREGIRTVPLALKLWTEVARFDQGDPASRFIRWVPLVLAPEWAAEHPDEGPERPGLDWVQDLFGRLAEKTQPPARPGAAAKPPTEDHDDGDRPQRDPR